MNDRIEAGRHCVWEGGAAGHRQIAGHVVVKIGRYCCWKRGARKDRWDALPKVRHTAAGEKLAAVEMTDYVHLHKVRCFDVLAVGLSLHLPYAESGAV